MTQSQRLTDRIRSLVVSDYVLPAKKAGRARLSVSVKDVRTQLAKGESMRGKSAVICQALQSKKLLSETGMTVEGVDGPPSKMSPRVVVHYLLAEGRVADGGESSATETSEAWAERVTRNIRGLLNDEMAAYGGGEAFLRWVRSEDEAEG